MAKLKKKNLTDRNAENVGLQLHQQPVGRHSSIYLQLSQRDAAVLIHGVQDLQPHRVHNQPMNSSDDGVTLGLVYLTCLKTDGLQRRKRHVALIGELS